jgi:hypothetical protein
MHEDEELLDPEEAERRISGFISEADQLPGTPVDELADAVIELLRRAWSEAATIMGGQAHNKVLATQLAIGQRARHVSPTDDEFWRLSAASTLLSGMIVPSSG